MTEASHWSSSSARCCRSPWYQFLSVVSGLLLGAALAAAVALWARKRINGYTGDVLGAIEQMFEIGFLLGVAAVIR